MEPESYDSDTESDAGLDFSDIIDVKAIGKVLDWFSELGLQDDKDDIPKLMPYVLDSSPDVRESALRCLANLDKKGIDAPVAKFCAWMDDGVADFRLFLLEVLTHIIEQKDNNAMAVLGSCLANQKITEGEDIDSISALNRVKVPVVEALAEISLKESHHAIRAFSGLLTDGDWRIRQSAEKALLQRADQDCQRTVLAVAEHLDHQDPSVVELALSILLKIADGSNQSIIPAVRGCCKNDASAIREPALMLLSNVGGKMQEEQYAGGYTTDAPADDEEKGDAVYCEVCEMWLNGPTQWEDHRIGKKHKKNCKRQECLPGADGKQGAQSKKLTQVPDSTAESDWQRDSHRKVDETYYSHEGTKSEWKKYDSHKKGDYNNDYSYGPPGVHRSSPHADYYGGVHQSHSIVTEQYHDWSQQTYPAESAIKSLGEEASVDKKTDYEEDGALQEVDDPVEEPVVDAWQSYTPAYTTTTRSTPPPPPPLPTESLSRSEAAVQRAMAKVMASKERGSAWTSEGKEWQAPPPPPLQAIEKTPTSKGTDAANRTWEAKPEAKAKEKAAPIAKVKIKTEAQAFAKELDDLAVGMLKVLQEFPQGLLLSQVKPHLQAKCGQALSEASFGCSKLQEVFRMPPLDKMFPMEVVPDRNEIKLKALESKSPESCNRKTPAPHTIPDRVRRRVEGGAAATASASSEQKAKGKSKGEPKAKGTSKGVGKGKKGKGGEEWIETEWY